MKNKDGCRKCVTGSGRKLGTGTKPLTLTNINKSELLNAGFQMEGWKRPTAQAGDSSYEEGIPNQTSDLIKMNQVGMHSGGFHSGGVGTGDKEHKSQRCGRFPRWRGGNRNQMQSRFPHFHGQMVFEFIIAVVVLIVVVFYVIGYLNSGVTAYSAQTKTNELESKNVQVSSLLLRGGGVWVSGIPKRVGLEKELSVLDSNKINDLNNYCNSNYVGLLENLGLIGKRVRIVITDTGGSEIIVCGPQLPAGVLNAHTKRFALSESNELLSVDVWVW